MKIACSSCKKKGVCAFYREVGQRQSIQAASFSDIIMPNVPEYGERDAQGNCPNGSLSIIHKHVSKRILEAVAELCMNYEEQGE